MPHVRRRDAIRLALCTPFVMASGGFRAQGSWPNRPVRFLMPLGPGGSADTAERIIYERVSEIPASRWRMQGAVAEAARHPDVLDRLLPNGTQPIGNTPEEFAVVLDHERKALTDVIVEARITISG